MDSVKLRIWRGDKNGGNFVEYALPAQEGEVVLDVVHRVQTPLRPQPAQGKVLGQAGHLEQGR